MGNGHAAVVRILYNESAETVRYVAECAGCGQERDARQESRTPETGNSYWAQK